MSTKKDTGIFQLDNGYWGYRDKIKIEGVLKESKRTFDEQGKPFKKHLFLQFFIVNISLFYATVNS